MEFLTESESWATSDIQELREIPDHLLGNLGNMVQLADHDLSRTFVKEPFTEHESKETRLVNGFLKAMSEQVMEYWIEPVRKSQTMGSIEVELSDTGILLDSSLRRSTGDPETDAMALRAVRSVVQYKVHPNPEINRRYFAFLIFRYSGSFSGIRTHALRARFGQKRRQLMQPSSQIILRNEAEFADKESLLVLNPPASDSLNHLNPALVITTDYRVANSHRSLEDRVLFGLTGTVQSGFDSALIYMPKSKGELKLLLAYAASLCAERACIYLVGEKKQGIASAAKVLGDFATNCYKIDSAKHCSYGAPLARKT